MPNIRTFEAPAGLGLQPTETGVQAAATAANRIGRNYDQLANSTSTVGNEFAKDMGAAVKETGQVIYDYIEHRERMAGASAFAQLQDNLTNTWNEQAKKADPNDPAVAERFREGVLEPALEKYREGFLTEGGQKFAESRVEQMRQHMFTKTAADMSSLAAAAVTVNMRQTANSFSNTANSDPSAVPTLLGQVDGLVNDIVGGAPNLKGADAARARMETTQRLKESIVKSGAIGAIAKSGDPERTAQEWGEKYKDFISGDELKMLAGNARQQIRAARIDQQYYEHQAEKAAQRRSDAAMGDYLKRLYSGDPKDQEGLSARNVVNDPNLLSKDKEHLIGIINREFKPETAAQISNRNSADLIDRMRLPDGDPNRITSLDAITDAYVKNQISKSDYLFVRKEFMDLRTPEGQRLGDRKKELVSAVSASITKSNPLMGKMDPTGDMNKYRFMVDLDAKVDEYRRAGKDPYDLFDPAKPDYFAKPENIQRYQKSLQDSMKDVTGRMRPAAGTAQGLPAPPVPAKVEPRKQGESAADYLKRTGGR